MSENSGVSESQVSVADVSCLNDQEVILLAMFRSMTVQRQMDVLRIFEVFAKNSEW